jgi:hypothetical protein
MPYRTAFLTGFNVTAEKPDHQSVLRRLPS